MGERYVLLFYRMNDCIEFALGSKAMGRQSPYAMQQLLCQMPNLRNTKFQVYGKVTVTAMNTYTVTFSVIDHMSDVEIGLKAENPTGNYLCVDNFKLQYIGAVTAEDYAAEVNQLAEQGRVLISKGIQNTVADSLNAAIAIAEEALRGTGTDENGTTQYDRNALAAARTLLQKTLADAYTSRTLYDALQSRIDYAEKVLAWWTDEPHKATPVQALKVAVAAAYESLTDYALTAHR